MSTRRRNKQAKIVYHTIPDSAYRKKTFFKWVTNYTAKYGHLTAFVAGALIFISGVVGEYLGLPGYAFTTNRLKDPSQLDPHYHKPELFPYWINCIFGAFLMYGYIKNVLFRNK